MVVVVGWGAGGGIGGLPHEPEWLSKSKYDLKVKKKKNQQKSHEAIISDMKIAKGLSFQQTNRKGKECTHTHTHTHALIHTHTHTHTLCLFVSLLLCLSLSLTDTQNMYIRKETIKRKCCIFKHKNKKVMPTAPGVPRRSPIQVLTGPDVA